MKREEMHAVIRQQVKRLRLLASGIKSRFAPEDIHSFRVEVKKLRAFMRLATAGNADFRLPKDLRHFYKALGTVRILQLQRKSLPTPIQDHELAVLVTLRATLDTQLQAAMNAVAALLPQNHRPFPDLTADLCTDLPIRLSGPYRHRFVRQTLQRLDPANHPLPPEDARLHDIRRAIKDLLYAWPYLSNSARRLAASPLGGRSQLRSAAQLLGDYLDAVSLTHIQLPAAGIAGHSAIGHWKRSCQEKKFGLRKTIDYTLGARLHFSPHPAPAATPMAFNPLTAGKPSQQSVELHLD